ncbi:uncharacterized protein LOC129748722 [Uranotaenia lowii]|uniref:uncharacterized protein LOC129748722 n=1 Tax=Uranotaenia lowii TaxID=190385 RepID=UPI00247AF672|nr:uncharacterized protein LOC129748722 [Uranotaenia lowii]
MKSFVYFGLVLTVVSTANSQLLNALNDLTTAGQNLRNTVKAANLQNPAVKSALSQISTDAKAFLAIAQRDAPKVAALESFLQNDLINAIGSLTSMLGELNSGVQNVGNLPVVKDALTRFIMNGTPVLNQIQNVLASNPTNEFAEALEAIRKIQSDVSALQIAAQL